MNAIDICNLGLSMLGARSILNFEDGDRGARLKSLYPAARDHVLGRHQWTQTLTYKKLTSRTEYEEGPWLYEYSLPLDCLRVISIFSPSPSTPVIWEKSGDKLLCNSSEPILRYVQRLEDPTKMGIDIQQLIALKLAELMAMSISQQPRLAMQFTQKFELEFALARARDLDQAYPDTSGDEPWHKHIHRDQSGVPYDWRKVIGSEADFEGGGP